jgi:putative DNA primase/helicase
MELEHSEMTGIAENYDDVVAQLQSIGLRFEYLEYGRLVRCRVEGDSEKRGWYSLHEFLSNNGPLLIVGSFGIWRGNENNAQKIELKRTKLSVQEREAIRARIAEDRRIAEARVKKQAAAAARRASAAWNRFSPTGHCVYLDNKNVKAHGVRFTDRGNMVVPICDENGSVHGLQVIYGDPEVKKRKGRDKDYWPIGVVKRGRFFLIGPVPRSVVLVAEGYATAATLHEATGLPVAVAFDAGNLLPVSQVLHKKFRKARILICADDDFLAKCPSCGKFGLVELKACAECTAPYSHGNAGIESASAAALAVGGAWLTPKFPERGNKKLTDFNDLQSVSTLATVASQVVGKLTELGWHVTDSPRLPDNGGAGDGPLKSLLSVDEAVLRYSIVYGVRGTLFDHWEHELVPKDSVLDLLPDHGWRTWKTHPDKKVVRVREVGFDPSETDATLRCNLWGGWPTAPKAGSCKVLLELLEYLCSSEQNTSEIFRWVLCWLAYPIQNPGAKMKTALIFHGPQGVGKNLFFEAVMGIYGPYGRIVDQAAIEDKFNDWASKKLFLIGDEVVARQELFHTKNKLKGFITGEWIRINPKNVAAHDEKNHVNIVFLSNEKQPLVIEEDDRRYVVIWTPAKLSRDFYNDVSDEIRAGGVAALHDYLLNLDMGDFKPWTSPPMTQAKADLISISRDSVERFIRDWTDGHTDFPVCPCASMDLYAAYLAWCRQNGVPRPRESNQFLGHVAKLPRWNNSPRYIYQDASYTGKGRNLRMVIPDEAILSKYDSQQPPEISMAHWLTNSYLAFREVFGRA